MKGLKRIGIIAALLIIFALKAFADGKVVAGIVALLVPVSFIAVILYVNWPKKGKADSIAKQQNQPSYKPLTKTEKSSQNASGGYSERWEDFKEHYDREYLAALQASARKLTSVAGQPDPQIGFYNMPKFCVRGKKRTTNRTNTREIWAKSKEEAAQIALTSEGLMEPLDIQVVAFRPAPPSEYGLLVPAGASYDDLFALESSVVAKDDTPTPAPFMSYLTELNIPASKLGGFGGAAGKALAAFDSLGKAELYGYAVDCSLRGCLPGNMYEDSRKDLYHAFALAAARHADVLKSINSRPGSDIVHPNKNTIAYRFAADYFK